MYLLYPPVKPNWARVCWYEGAFTKEECEKIIQLGESIEPQKAVINLDGTQDDTQRKSEISWIPWTTENSWIFDKLAHYVLDCNAVRYQMDLSGFTEKLQFTKYREGHFYKWHQDFDKEAFSIRKLSISVLLSDPSEYEGGDLKFFNFNHEIPNKQGTVILFPSFEQHCVGFVKKGTRHSLVAWISGPPYK